MTWISNFFSRYWRNVHFITIAIVVVVFVYGYQPINSFTSNSLLAVFNYPFFQIKTTIKGLSDVQKENERLIAALVDASGQISQREEDRLENMRLRAVLGFDPPPSYSMLPAKVLSLSPGQVAITAVINKGAVDSIEINQPVVNEFGLIGRVLSVSENFATIQLLTDPANRVASRVQRTRDMGIAKFQAGAGMILDNFPIQSEIFEGDTIISSGLGQVYPSGLRIGTISDIIREPDAVFSLVHLKTFVNFSRLDELFVLRMEIE